MEQLIYFIPPIITVVFGYYLFFNYKRYIKRKKIRIGLHSEIKAIVRKSEIYESVAQETKQLPPNLVSWQNSFYEKNLDNLHYLTDVEIKKIVQIYAEVEESERMMKYISESFSDEEGKMSEDAINEASKLTKDSLEGFRSNAYNTLLVIYLAMREEEKFFRWSTIEGLFRSDNLTIKSEGLDNFTEE
jgi:hypothetical protein